MLLVGLLLLLLFCLYLYNLEHSGPPYEGPRKGDSKVRLVARHPEHQAKHLHCFY